MLRFAAVLAAVLGLAACEGTNLGSGSSYPQTASTYPSGRWGTPSPIYREQQPVYRNYPATDPWGRSTARTYPGYPVYGSGSSLPGRSIRIHDARYVAPSGRSCNAERQLERGCDGEAACRIRVSDSLCGDPDPNAAKTLVVNYSCGGRRMEARARERQTLTLRC